MLMKPDDVKLRRKLVNHWELCVICGHEFANLACVTKEHIVPKCRLKPNKHNESGNIAASHYTCNNLRRANSIIAAAKEVERRRRTMKHKDFLRWLNKVVPARIVPAEALRSLYRPLACFELPEHLPGT